MIRAVGRHRFPASRRAALRAVTSPWAGRSITGIRAGVIAALRAGILVALLGGQVIIVLFVASLVALLRAGRRLVGT